MLGAQALRTKQKAEQKEKEKRQRDRLKSIEIQREKMHRQACEEAAAAGLLDLDQLSLHQHMERNMQANPPKHRHSLHSSNTQQLHVKKSSEVTRCSSSDSCRGDPQLHLNNGKRDSKDSGSGGNRFMRWLGLADSTPHTHNKIKSAEKRRMSTFT